MFSSDEAELYFGKFLIGLAIFMLALVGLGWCGATVLKPIIYPAEQAGVIAERTLNADNVIYNYEWFHQHYTDWQAAGTNADAKERELNNALTIAGPASSWNLATQREISQLRVELSGLRAHRVNIANEYNAHTAMANRDLFRSRSLPERLDTN
jgi:hypothetical protein